MIEMDLSEDAYNEIVVPFFQEYFGHIFEDIATQYLIRRNKEKKLSHLYSEFGKWWGTNKETKKQEEIDIVASNKSAALFGECKWSNSKIGLGVYETLKSRSDLTQNGKSKEYYLFSKTGYTNELYDLKTNALTLVCLDDLT